MKNKRIKTVQICLCLLFSETIMKCLYNDICFVLLVTVQFKSEKEHTLQICRLADFLQKR